MKNNNRANLQAQKEKISLHFTTIAKISQIDNPSIRKLLKIEVFVPLSNVFSTVALMELVDLLGHAENLNRK